MRILTFQEFLMRHPELDEAEVGRRERRPPRGGDRRDGPRRRPPRDRVHHPVPTTPPAQPVVYAPAPVPAPAPVVYAPPPGAQVVYYPTPTPTPAPAPAPAVAPEVVEAVSGARAWGPLTQLGAHLRIRAAQGHRAFLFPLKEGLFLVAAVPEGQIEGAFGSVLLAPLVIQAATKALTQKEPGQASLVQQATQALRANLPPGTTVDAPEEDEAPPVSGFAAWLAGVLRRA